MNLQQLLVQSIKDKDQVKINTLRLLISEVQKVEKNRQKPNIIKIVQKEISKREESLGYCEKMDRFEASIELNKEIDFLKTLLPEQISESVLITIIKGEIDSDGYAGLGDMKVILSRVTKRVEGSISPSLIVKHCKELLLKRLELNRSGEDWNFSSYVTSK